jgi:hypothetical protein
MFLSSLEKYESFGSSSSSQNIALRDLSCISDVLKNRKKAHVTRPVYVAHKLLLLFLQLALECVIGIVAGNGYCNVLSDQKCVCVCVFCFGCGFVCKNV